MSLEQDLKIIKNAELDIELLHRDNEKLCATNNEEIANLEDKIKSTEFILEEELKVSKEDKLECKFDGYKGTISWKKMPDEWIYTEDVLMNWIMSLPAKLGELYLKVVTTVKKGDLKKQIISYNDMLFEKSIFLEKWSENVELLLHTEKKDFKVKGIKIKPQEKRFKYTIKKIK